MVSTSYGPAQLNGIADWILSGIESVVNKLLQTIFQPVLYLFYEVLIWVPLQVINALIILFKFFATGFSSIIFGGQVNSDGTISYSFDFTSPLGQIFFFVLVLSLVLFFFYFILSFVTQKNTTLQSLFSLKWPFIMFVLMFATPAILIVADSLMGALLSALDGSAPHMLSSADKDNLMKNLLAPNTGDFAMIAAVDSHTQIIAALQKIHDLVAKDINLISANQGSDDYNFGILSSYLTDTQTHLDTLLNGGISTLSGDFATLNNMVLGWNPGSSGMYISDDNARTINGVIDHITTVQTTFYSLIADLSHLNGGDCKSGWTDLQKCADAQDPSWDVKSDIINGLQGISDGMKNTTDTTAIGYYFSMSYSSDGTTSLANKIIGTSTTYPTLSALVWYRQVTPPAAVVQVLYQVITGDPNPNNWDRMPAVWGGSILGTMTAFQWVIGTFACWGMILIIYSFTSSAIKRTYYIIGYWIIGFFYLANGLNNSQGVITWYKMVWGKWIGVLVMYVLFTVAGILLVLIKPAIAAGMTQYNDYSYGGENILITIAMILALEAAYQAAYQISQEYLGQWGAKDEEFKAANPLELLSQGSALLGSTLSKAEHYATGGPVKDMYKKYDEYKEYWGKKSDTKLKRENDQWQAAGRITGANDQAKKLNDVGYGMKRNVFSKSGFTLEKGQKGPQEFLPVPLAKPDGTFDNKNPLYQAPPANPPLQNGGRRNNHNIAHIAYGGLGYQNTRNRQGHQIPAPVPRNTNSMRSIAYGGTGFQNYRNRLANQQQQAPLLNANANPLARPRRRRGSMSSSSGSSSSRRRSGSASSFNSDSGSGSGSSSTGF